MKIKLPIKCCCDAGKLLGFVEIEKPKYQYQEINLPTTEGSLITLPVGTINARTKEYKVEYAAIKSNDTPIEDLRKIVGFEEYAVEKPDAGVDPVGAVVYAMEAEKKMAEVGALPPEVADYTAARVEELAALVPIAKMIGAAIVADKTEGGGLEVAIRI